MPLDTSNGSLQHTPHVAGHHVANLHKHIVPHPGGLTHHQRRFLMGAARPRLWSASLTPETMGLFIPLPIAPSIQGPFM